MKTRRLFIIGLLTSLMFGYQNCAENPAVQPFDQEISQEYDGTVTSIDDVNQGTDVAFLKSAVTVHEDVEIFHIDGLCSEEQNGAILAWTLEDDEGQIERGRSFCEGGRFQVDLEAVNELPCGDMTLSARLGMGEQGVVNFHRRCLETEPIEVASTGPVCFREYFASEGRCERACYDEEGGLLNQVELDLNLCQ